MIEQPVWTKQRSLDRQGANFGRYHISGVLGRGDLGRLYVAEQRGVGGFVKVVVLKHVLPHLADAVQFQEMFLNEAKIAAALDHANIVATFELGEVDGKYFICMEYLPGEDAGAILSHCHPDAPVPFDIAAALIQQSAQGLHYAHEMCDTTGELIGLVHGDVNPFNIFVTYHGIAKMLDFGAVGEDVSHKSIPGVFKGKFAYCAPEQVDGGGIDRRTDVFALGIVLWECLTGTRLFNSGTDSRTIEAVRSLSVRPPSALRGDVPWQLDEIVLRALSRDPERRYQTAQEMANAIDGFLSSRQERPTSLVIGQWLESLFGPERALLKKAIAQGSATAKNLARLRALDEGKASTGDGSRPSGGLPSVQPRALWSTNRQQADSRGSSPDPLRNTPGSGSPPLSTTGDFPPPPIPQARTTREVSAPIQEQRGDSGEGSGRASVVSLKVVVAIGATVLVASLVGLGVFLNRGPAPDVRSEASARPPTTTLELASQPPGAHIFVDGDPSGLKTPAVLTELRSGRSVEVRVDLMGHQSARRRVDLQGGASQRLDFFLQAATGAIYLEGLPRRATTYVDDVRIDARQPFSLPVGTHRLRVELGDELLLSRTIDVQPAGLTLRIGAGPSR